MAVDRARVIEADNNAWVEVTLHEGKQHEVKRLLEAVGHPVSKLRRVAIGPVTSRGLEPGQFRALAPEEIEGLRRGKDAGSGALGRLARRASRGRGPRPRVAREAGPRDARSDGADRLPRATQRRARTPAIRGRRRAARRARAPARRPEAADRRSAAERTAMSAARAAGFVFPKHLEGLDRFEPGKPIGEVQRELGLRDVVKLASNENPLGPSPLAVEAARGVLGDVNRYADPQATELRQALSRHLDVPVEQILAGNGSVEIIELVARALLGPGDNAVISEHAFVRFRQIVNAHNQGARLVPMRDFTHDLRRDGGARSTRARGSCSWRTRTTRPAPGTGGGEVEALVAALPPGCLLLLDEAYFEYA